MKFTHEKILHEMDTRFEEKEVVQCSLHMRKYSMKWTQDLKKRKLFNAVYTKIEQKHIF